MANVKCSQKLLHRLGNGESIDVSVNVRDDCTFEQSSFMNSPECECYTGIVKTTSTCNSTLISLVAESNNTLEGGFWTILQGTGTIDDINDPNTFYTFGDNEMGSEVIISWTQPPSGNCSTVIDVITLDQIICIPTLSEWSILVLSLLLLIVGVIGVQSIRKSSVYR